MKYKKKEAILVKLKPFKTNIDLTYLLELKNHHSNASDLSPVYANNKRKGGKGGPTWYSWMLSLRSCCCCHGPATEMARDTSLLTSPLAISTPGPEKIDLKQTRYGTASGETKV